MLGLICHLGTCFLISPSVLCPVSLFLPSFGLIWYFFCILFCLIAQLPTVWVGQQLALLLNSTPGLSWKISLHPALHLVKAHCLSEGSYSEIVLLLAFSELLLCTQQKFLSPSVVSQPLMCVGCALGASCVKENWQVGMELFFD